MKHFNFNVFVLFVLIFVLSPGVSYKWKNVKSLGFDRSVRYGRRSLQSTAFAACSFPERSSKLRKLLQQKELSVMPCCYDGLSARMVEAAG